MVHELILIIPSLRFMIFSVNATAILNGRIIQKDSVKNKLLFFFIAYEYCHLSCWYYLLRCLSRSCQKRHKF